MVPILEILGHSFTFALNPPAPHCNGLLAYKLKFDFLSQLVQSPSDSRLLVKIRPFYELIR